MNRIIIVLSVLCSLSFSSLALSTSKVLGFGVVVRDVVEATEHYNNILGLNKWNIVDLNAEAGAVRLAQAEFRGKTIELLQPLYGDSLVAQFLDSHGPGLFHLELSKAAVLNEVVKIETMVAESDHWPQQPQEYRANWFNSYKALGIYIKQSNRTLAGDDFWGEKLLQARTIPLSNARLDQLGIVVKDAMATAKQWQKILSLQPWVFVDFKPPMVSNGQYHGVKSSAFSHVHVGYGQLDDLQIELLQPVAGPTPHRDYLRAYQQGAHHISLGRLQSHDALNKHYQQQGIRLQMQSDNGGAGRTASYMGTEQELGWVLELTRPFTGLGSLTISNSLGMPAQKGKQ